MTPPECGFGRLFLVLLQPYDVLMDIRDSTDVETLHIGNEMRYCTLNDKDHRGPHEIIINGQVYYWPKLDNRSGE